MKKYDLFLGFKVESISENQIICTKHQLKGIMLNNTETILDKTETSWPHRIEGPTEVNER